MVADAAALLGNPQDDDEPPPVPLELAAEPEDPLPPRVEHLRGLRRHRHAGAAAEPLAREPAVSGTPGDSLPRGLLGVAERHERSDERLLPHGAVPRHRVLAEHREEHRPGRRRSDAPAP